ncbi:MAG: NYN domain-containing protein [Planctomycetia bacterium]
MHVLVDGHNALHRLGLQRDSREAERHALLDRVRRLEPRATVFFDALHGSPLGGGPGREHGIAVHYCTRDIADHEIVREVRARLEQDRREPVLVVTDDHELAGRCRQVGAQVRSVHDWFGADDEPAPAPPPSARGPHDKPLSAADFGFTSGQAIDLLAGGRPPGRAPSPAPRTGAGADAGAGTGAAAGATAGARGKVEAIAAGRPVRHLLLCAEPTKAKCADAATGRAAWEHLKRRVAELGLDPLKPPAAGLSGPCVLRTKVDCLRVCAEGPIAVVYPDGTWYRGVTAAVAERILVEHVLGGRPVREHLLGRAPLGGPGASS